MISAGVLAVVADDGEGSKLGGAETSDDSEIRLLTPRLRWMRRLLELQNSCYNAGEIVEIKL